MLSDESKEIIKNAFYETIEKSAFMFGDEVDEEELEIEYDSFLLAFMTFKGEGRGKLSLIVPEKMCPEIAANFLGVEPDDEKVSSCAEDALKEILNVTCGHVLTDLKGKKAVFDLTVPQIKRIKKKDWNSYYNNEDSILCIVDDYPVLIHFQFED
ncbi:MAG: chemotaxis protein CheX [Candidatus Marinimicrobia bacterium]|nr:chemotaxis protein CheX [Candidatus Neomarinimicrobiota bacterium]